MITPFKNEPITKLHEFVQNSTVADTKEEVVKHICYFIQKNSCTSKVRNLLGKILTNESLLEKTVIVNQSDYYQTVITIKKDKAIHQEEEKQEKLLTLYEKEAEIIFLNLVFENEQRSEQEIKRANQRRKKNWSFLYSQEKIKILSMLLDEWNVQMKLYKVTNNKKNKEKADKWKTILHYCNQ